MERRGPDPRDDGGPSARSLVVAAILVVALVAVGLFIARDLLDMSRLQDCAATGRADC